MLLGMPCLYDSKQHSILGGGSEILDWCRRQVPDDMKDKLFLYRHRRYGTFVVARWAAQPKWVFSDILNLGTSLSNFDREKAQEFMKRIYAPVTAKDIIKAAEQTERVQASLQEEMQMEEMEEARRQFKELN